MDTNLQKPSVVTLTFQKRPEEFLTQLSISLDTLQKVYRTKLPESEIAIWCETLKEFSFEEFDLAMRRLICNPPKYELEDGSIQVWRGMPKLPDVIDVMLRIREELAAESRDREAARDRAHYKVLARRREEHPEEFGGTWADVLKEFSEKYPDKSLSEFAMPDVPELDLTKNAVKLAEQKRKLHR